MKAEALSSASTFKTSIRNVVTAYKLQHPDEYQLVRQAVEMQRKLLHDPKYATMEGSPDHRGLYEISETLQAALITYLDVDGLTWFKSTEGGRWFAKTYREFALPTDI